MKRTTVQQTALNKLMREVITLLSKLSKKSFEDLLSGEYNIEMARLSDDAKNLLITQFLNMSIECGDDGVPDLSEVVLYGKITPEICQKFFVRNEIDINLRSLIYRYILELLDNLSDRAEHVGLEKTLKSIGVES